MIRESIPEQLDAENGFWLYAEVPPAPARRATSGRVRLRFDMRA